MKVKRQALRRKDTPKGIICFSRESRENKAWASHRRVVIHVSLLSIGAVLVTLQLSFKGSL